MGERSATERKSRIDDPVHRPSTLRAPRPARTSSTSTVLKSIEKRVLPLVLGTLECNWCPENCSRPPTGGTNTVDDERSTGSLGPGSGRLSPLTLAAATARCFAFHW